jgi:hypothetical protein
MIVQQHVVHTKTTQGSGVVRALLSARTARAVQRSDATKLQSTNSAILEFPSDVPIPERCAICMKLLHVVDSDIYGFLPRNTSHANSDVSLTAVSWRIGNFENGTYNTRII